MQLNDAIVRATLAALKEKSAVETLYPVSQMPLVHDLTVEIKEVLKELDRGPTDTKDFASIAVLAMLRMGFITDIQFVGGN